MTITTINLPKEIDDKKDYFVAQLKDLAERAGKLNKELIDLGVEKVGNCALFVEITATDNCVPEAQIWSGTCANAYRFELGIELDEIER